MYTGFYVNHEVLGGGELPLDCFSLEVRDRKVFMKSFM